MNSKRVYGIWYIVYGESKQSKTINYRLLTINQKGQSLLELIIVIAVGIVIVTALVFSAISSLRNSALAKNQAQATRLSQEGIETLRILRDRDGSVSKGGISCNTNPCKFNTDWSVLYSCPSNAICYFKINADGNSLTSTTESFPETFISTGDLRNFTRLIQVVDVLDSNNVTVPGEKNFTSLVKWTDFAGNHESRQTTVLRKT